MSTAILPDGSVLVHLAFQVVHLDVRTRAIHLRAPDEGEELGGKILESFPQVALDRVRILRAPENQHHLSLELMSGRAISLGNVASHEVAMMTSRVIADLTRCKVEISEGVVRELPGPSEAFLARTTLEQHFSPLESGPDHFEEPTRAAWDVEDEEAETLPPPPPPPRAKSMPRVAAPSIVIADDVDGAPPALIDASFDELDAYEEMDALEDPLDQTVCRPASTEERVLWAPRPNTLSAQTPASGTAPAGAPRASTEAPQMRKIAGE